ncbi:DUF2169 domain-containing protein [Sulfidibacter corallicola]|uniref:DUF2169 domain-containing protein n=1 Tax=Sulfidibacter corallicola TaxID=2818388 RepID=A0A8A4TNN7_SULCO|nr:DUF2169 domain-containing protein [Sulfidibacter corallicola]QTD51586.1 DUF2169 domain-containing protein [Sulfidibacter corallicola]
MSQIENYTPYALERLLTADKDGREFVTAVVSATFHLPKPGLVHVGPLTALAEQPPIALEETYAGEPGQSSLLVDTQSLIGRPGTDIALNGKARTPGRKPQRQCDTSVRVGTIEKSVRVFGNRVWTSGMLGLKPSDPEFFTEFPLSYECAFGGSAVPDAHGMAPFEERNPVGVGFYGSRREALDKPLPNLEDPRDLIDRVRDRPRPAGYGLVARMWMPRRQLSGTFDERWQRERAPLWPEDLDPRFFHAAHPDLITPKPLAGNEPVHLRGFAHEGDFLFELPNIQLSCGCTFRGTHECERMVLDGLYIDTEARTLTMTWRASFAAMGRVLDWRRLRVRQLETWELAA